MNFFKMVFNGWKEPWDVELLTSNLHLPKVFDPVHQSIRAAGGSVPFELSPASPVYSHLVGHAEEHIITEEEWQSLVEMLAAEIKATGRTVPTIYPGMRIGPLRLRLLYENEPPDYFPTVADSLWSQRLIELFVKKKFTGYDVYLAYVEGQKASGKSTPLAYYEFPSIAEVPLAPEANWKQDGSYTALILDQERARDFDFVHPQRFFSDFILVSERVKEAIEEARIYGLVFVPSDHLAHGPGTKTMTEILADIEVELQWAARAQNNRSARDF